MKRAGFTADRILAVLAAAVTGLLASMLAVDTACHVAYLEVLDLRGEAWWRSLGVPELLRPLLLLVPAGLLTWRAARNRPGGPRVRPRIWGASLAIGAAAGLAIVALSGRNLVACRDGIPAWVTGARPMESSGADPAYAITVNGDGLRGPPREPSRPAVLLVGDSFTFGAGVGDDDTMAAALERLLPGFQVLNGGLSGDNLSGDLQRARSLVERFRPAALVLIVAFNDLSRASSTTVCALPPLCRPRVPFYRVDSVLSSLNDPSAGPDRVELERVGRHAAALDEAAVTAGTRVWVHVLDPRIVGVPEALALMPAGWIRVPPAPLSPGHFFDPAGNSHLNEAGNAFVASGLAAALGPVLAAPAPR